jgi:hypothetical protein
MNGSGGGARYTAPARPRHSTAHPGEDLGNPLNRPIPARASHDAAVRPGR